MAFLNLGPVEVKATTFRRLPDERGGGGLRRSVNGHLRGVSDWVKRGYAGDLLALDDTELAAVLAQANPDLEVTVTGDALPGVASLTARVEVSGDIRYERTGAGWFYHVPVTIREV